jgi:hypothetical protein
MQEVAHDDVLGFVDRGSHTTLTVHEGQRLDSNYSLNTVDICPVGALTSKDFRFKMRVWFLRETKSICTSCGTGCNTIIGARENEIIRQTPRQNDAVNSYWMCDHGRLNYGYLYREDRLVQPQLRENGQLQKSTWPRVTQEVAQKLSAVPHGETALLASARMTNEELWLAGKIARHLGITLHDVVARPQKADGILVSDDGNPNTTGAQLLGITHNEPGAKANEIAAAVRNGKVKALLCLGEDPRHYGLTEAELAHLDLIVCLDILPNTATKLATAILPGAGFAENAARWSTLKAASSASTARHSPRAKPAMTGKFSPTSSAPSAPMPRKPSKASSKKCPPPFRRSNVSPWPNSATKASPSKRPSGRARRPRRAGIVSLLRSAGPTGTQWRWPMGKGPALPDWSDLLKIPSKPRYRANSDAVAGRQTRELLRSG